MVVAEVGGKKCDTCRGRRIADVARNGHADDEASVSHRIVDFHERLCAVLVNLCFCGAGVVDTRDGIHLVGQDGVDNAAEGVGEGGIWRFDVSAKTRHRRSFQRLHGSGCQGLAVDAVEHHCVARQCNRESRVAQEGIFEFIDGGIGIARDERRFCLEQGFSEGGRLTALFQQEAAESGVQFNISFGKNRARSTQHGYCPAIGVEESGAADVGLRHVVR